MKTLYASVDLGGTNISCALSDADGQIVCEEKIPTQSHEGPAAVLERIANLVNKLAEQAGAKPKAVGMGVPGLADVEHGVTKFLPNFPTKWREVRVREILAPRIGCEVYLLNDVRTATLGELQFGLGRTAQTMIFFALGTGVGGGVVIDGRLRLGPYGAAGEFGHLTIVPDGPICGCGSRGCLETLISGPALSAEGVRLMRSGLAPRLHELVGGDISAISPRTMAIAAVDGDEAVRGAIVRAANYLGIAVSNMIMALHPELIVIGGGVALMGDVLLNAVREEVKERVRMLPLDGIRIQRSQLGDRAGVMGGVALAMRGGLDLKLSRP